MTELAKKVNIKQPISADHVAIHEDPFHPSAYVISLPLDSYPTYAWQTLFESELWSSLDFWDRKVIVIGNEIKLVTTGNNLQDKLNWLEKLVTATNKRVEEYNKKANAEKETKGLKHDTETVRTELSKWLFGRASG